MTENCDITLKMFEGDGLPVSAVPGSAHNTTVSRTSVRPKVCNQVTGRCKGGGLESPPTNKLHMSTPEERNVLPKSHETRGLQPGNFTHVTILEGSPNSGGKPGTVAPGKTGLQESYRLPKRKRTRITICTYTHVRLHRKRPSKI
ncbi:hypothetical protein NECAME_07048 [Necator americanus]|uniref:Uncharacterized protein n=1 Tax=Necator americanus TaxID=51031 RepID=W2TPU1_NECAM|nr:hypothetical protein NECAME_07048 [Necator americanus]ETN84100.1 hypothetical protein NECAME_07048 [Necator americanus]